MITIEKHGELADILGVSPNYTEEALIEELSDQQRFQEAYERGLIDWEDDMSMRDFYVPIVFDWYFREASTGLPQPTLKRAYEILLDFIEQDKDGDEKWHNLIDDLTGLPGRPESPRWFVAAYNRLHDDVELIVTSKRIKE